jgi:hypothetical protein
VHGQVGARNVDKTTVHPISSGCRNSLRGRWPSGTGGQSCTGTSGERPVKGAFPPQGQEAEAVLSKLPHRGVLMILRELKSRNGVAYKPFSYSGFEKIVQQMRAAIGDLPSYFTLDACRHGGMTELEEAALTEGQGRALSGHKTAQAYRGYAKETFDRALAATRKRHAHRVANIDRTSIQNEGQNDVQNEVLEPKATNAK